MRFNYTEKGKKKSIEVEVCNTLWKKFSGLMFRKDGKALLFPLGKEKNLMIHSFFCMPFTAIWLNNKKIVAKKEFIGSWKPCISGKGRYLLEIPTITPEK